MRCWSQFFFLLVLVCLLMLLSCLIHSCAKREEMGWKMSMVFCSGIHVKVTKEDWWIL